MNPAARAAELQALFERIAATRMAGIPLLHPGLQVRALGFEPLEDGALGVLSTPWFMNLVFLPGPDEAPLRPGDSRVRAVGGHRFPFIGAEEPGFGAWQACSLFSPMDAFEDQAAAEATALAVLAELRKPPEVQPDRRALLFGRRPEARA